MLATIYGKQLHDSTPLFFNNTGITFINKSRYAFEECIFKHILAPIKGVKFSRRKESEMAEILQLENHPIQYRVFGNSATRIFIDEREGAIWRVRITPENAGQLPVDIQLPDIIEVGEVGDDPIKLYRFCCGMVGDTVRPNCYILPGDKPSVVFFADAWLSLSGSGDEMAHPGAQLTPSQLVKARQTEFPDYPTPPWAIDDTQVVVQQIEEVEECAMDLAA